MELEDLIEDYLKENSLKQLARDLDDLKVYLPDLPKKPMALAQAIQYALDAQERWEDTERALKERESQLIIVISYQ